MSDFFPLAWHSDSIFGGLISPNEPFWQDMNRLHPDAVPMTKAETIMRRWEAIMMHRYGRNLLSLSLGDRHTIPAVLVGNPDQRIIVQAVA